MVISWVTCSSWLQQDGCPRHAMLRVIPSQCLGIMPGFHVPDGLDNVKIKIQERLPVCYPLPTGYIGGPWIIWFMRMLKSMVSYRRLWDVSSTPPGCSCCTQKVPDKSGAPPVTLGWPYQSGIGSVPEKVMGDFMFMVSISCPPVGLQCLDN